MIAFQPKRGGESNLDRARERLRISGKCAVEAVGGGRREGG